MRYQWVDGVRLTQENVTADVQAPSQLGVRSIPFNYRLGRLTLFQLRLPLFVIEFEPGALSVPLRVIVLPDPGQSRGYLIKGLPVTDDGDLAFGRSGWFSRIIRKYSLYSIDLTETYDSYMKKFSSDTRRKFKRRLRDFQILSGGTLKWKEYRSRAELEEFLPLAMQVSKKTYQERLLNAGLPDTQIFRDATLAQAELGEVRGFLLFVQETPVSYALMPVVGTRVVYSYIGYDPEFRDYSPGTVLELLAIQQLFADPAVKMLDFTEGRGPHKQIFATHCTHCADVVILRRELSNSIAMSSHALVQQVAGGIGTLLSAIGIKRHVHKLTERLAAFRRRVL